MKQLIPSLDQYIRESRATINEFQSIKYNSHALHNSNCDIVVGQLDNHTHITYGIYIKGPNKGNEFMEYYAGQNYNANSDKRSRSSYYNVSNIPSKYLQKWEELKNLYITKYINENSHEDNIDEGIEYIPSHPKCKGKIERKIMSINELRTGELYMLTIPVKNGLVWTDGWNYEGQIKEDNEDMFVFKSTNDLYDTKEIKYYEDELQSLIMAKKVAKQK